MTTGVELATAYVSLIPEGSHLRVDTVKQFRTIEDDAVATGRRAGDNLGHGISDGVERGVSTARRSVATGAKIVAGLFGSAGAAGAAMGLRTAAGMETANIAFETMLGSSAKAGAFLNDLSQFAARTPFEFPDLQRAAQSLISVGVNASRVIPIMTAIGNATAGMGTGADGVQRAMIALQQMIAAQRISAEDLNQLRDAGIPVYDLLAKATGKTTAEVAKLAATGKLGKTELDQMMAALESGKGLERFNGMMDRQSTTLSGLVSTLHDTVNIGLAQAMQPLMPLLKDGLAAAIDLIGAKAPAMAVGMQRLLTGGRGLAELFRSGMFTDELTKAFGWTPSSGIIRWMRDVRYDVVGLWADLTKFGVGVRGLVELFRTKLFTPDLKAGFGWSPSSPAVAFMRAVRDHSIEAWQGFQKLRDYAGGFLELLGQGTTSNRLTALGINPDEQAKALAVFGKISSDVGGFVADIKANLPSLSGDWLSSLGQAASQVLPVVTAALKDLPALGPTFEMIGKGLQFVGEHMDVVAKALPYIVGGIMAFKGLQALNSVIGRDSAIGMVAQIGSNTALAASNFSLARSHQAVAIAAGEQAVAENVGMLTRVRATVATVASTAASWAAQAASKAWAGAQWVLNAALTANPIGLVVVAIAALVAGAIWAYHHIEWFHDAVDAAWDGIRTAAAAAVSWFQETAWPVLKTIFEGLGTAIGWLWEHIAKPAWEGFKTALHLVGEAATWLWNNAFQPALKFIINGLGMLTDGFATMLDILGNVPGFEWAKTAAEKMHGAADKAHELADNLAKIPPHVDSTVVLTFSAQTTQAFRDAMDGVGRSRTARINDIAGYRATGGPVLPGHRYVVGERRAEILDMPLDGGMPRILPTATPQDVGAGAGGTTHVYNFNGDVKASSYDDLLRFGRQRRALAAMSGAQ